MRIHPVIALLLLVLFLVSGVWVMTWRNSQKISQGPDETLDIEALRQSIRKRAPGPTPGFTVPPGVASAAATNREGRLARLLSGESETNEFELSREQLDAYLARTGRSAEGLLAAAQLSPFDDRARLLREAAEKFHNDPRVQFAMVTADTNTLALAPAERRQWLEAFKQGASDNSLPALLSAREYFKAGQTQEALAEIAQVGGHRRYNDYTLEAVQNLEEAYLSAGYSTAEAKAVSMSSVLLPQMSELSGLSRNLADLEKQYRAAGDTQSADGIMMAGIQIAQRMSGENQPTLIQELVAMAMERRLLNSNANPAFINASERLAQLDARRSEIKDIVKAVDLQQAFQTASEADIIAYFDRMKIQGEYNAMLWLRQRLTNGP